MFGNSIRFRYFEGGKSWHTSGQFGVPEYHFKNNTEIVFLNKTLKVPYDYIGYLDYQYGNWKEPIKEKSYSNYKNYDLESSFNKVRAATKKYPFFKFSK